MFAKNKRLLFIVLLVLFVAALAVMPVMAQGSEPPIPGLELTAAQLVLVGIVASTLTAFLRFLVEFASKQKIIVPDIVMQIIVWLVGGGVAWLWFPPSLPTWPALAGLDVGTQITIFLNDFATPLFTVMSAWFVIAGLFYKYFMQRVYNKIGQMAAPKVFAK